MDSKPLISIVIPCHNAGRFLAETLESVFSQAVKDFEIIIIDDGSTDGTASLIRSYGSKVRAEFCPHRGVSAARNRGTELARGKFIQYLDADDLLAPDKLTLQLAAFGKSNADITYGDWQKLKETKGGKYVKAGVVINRMQNPEVDLFADYWYPPAVYLFRRSIVENVKGWNEGLPVIQDARFALDCALHGGRFIYCPGVMAYYREHLGGSVSTRDSIEFIRDCFKNANEIKEWWEEYGGIDTERRKALLKVYEHIARASFEKDRLLFELAYKSLKGLKPDYIPERPKHLQLAARLLGYPNAETLALYFRRTKKVFKKIIT